jgi:hypothetical protein
MSEYKKSAPGGKVGMIITATLDGISSEMTRRLKWYNNPTL